MKIIITAGGTIENIDDVRAITNSSTGSLGYAISQAFLGHHKNELKKIYYLHGLKAKFPEDEKVENIAIGGVMDLQATMKKLLKEEKIDAVIQAMAVSDYVIHEVTTLNKIRGLEDNDDADLTANKISSDIDDLVLHMKRSPKVIGMIKDIAPDTVLVGFKLLSGVMHSELIDVGYQLLQKNKCDFVLANDLKEIGKDFHKGYLIHEDKSYDVMKTNEEIADMIANRVTLACSERNV